MGLKRNIEIIFPFKRFVRRVLLMPQKDGLVEALRRVQAPAPQTSSVVVAEESPGPSTTGIGWRL